MRSSTGWKTLKAAIEQDVAECPRGAGLTARMARAHKPAMKNMTIWARITRPAFR
jgi:hypothetical protein